MFSYLVRAFFKTPMSMETKAVPTELSFVKLFCLIQSLRL
jgi:hypothetical protein